jgi:hypothetical protein
LIENIPPFVGLFVFVEERLNSFGSLSLRNLVDIRNLEHGSVGGKGSTTTSLQMAKHLRCNLSEPFWLDCSNVAIEAVLARAVMCI